MGKTSNIFLKFFLFRRFITPSVENRERRRGMKFATLAAFLALLLAGTAGAATVDFRNGATFGGAFNQPSFSASVDGFTVTVAAWPFGARLWWDSTDGVGVRYAYENDEIESRERLRIAFSTPVHLSRVLVTDLFNEGYLERGYYQLNGSGTWVEFSADSSQTPSSSNGQLTLTLDPTVPVSSILFRAPGRILTLNQNHEFSVARIEVVATPIPAALYLLGSGLLGLAVLRRRRKW
jgi:hypothetical protein